MLTTTIIVLTKVLCQGRYDYSAVVYLTTKGVDFDGGDFAFHDAYMYYTAD